MLHAIRDSSSSREAPNTTPVVFTSRQYTRSTTAPGGRGGGRGGGVRVHQDALRARSGFSGEFQTGQRTVLDVEELSFCWRGANQT